MMAHSPSPRFPLFSLALLCFASCCQAQDAIQIVARAALCFDNRPVINSCLASMGIITDGTAAAGTNGTAAAGNNGKNNGTTTISGGSPSGWPKQKRNSTSVFCGSPCHGQMMMMAGCVDGIMSSFQFYSPGLLQGVQAIFQMACRGSNNTNATNTTTAFSSSHVAPGGVGASNGGNVIVKPILMHLLMLCSLDLLFVNMRFIY